MIKITIINNKFGQILDIMWFYEHISIQSPQMQLVGLEFNPYCRPGYTGTYFGELFHPVPKKQSTSLLWWFPCLLGSNVKVSYPCKNSNWICHIMSKLNISQWMGSSAIKIKRHNVQYCNPSLADKCNCNIDSAKQSGRHVGSHIGEPYQSSLSS